MTLKGSQRAGAKQLDLHLLKTEENEHVELHEIRGFVAENVIGARREAGVLERERVNRARHCARDAAPADLFADIEVFHNQTRRHGGRGHASPADCEASPVGPFENVPETERDEAAAMFGFRSLQMQQRHRPAS